MARNSEIDPDVPRLPRGRGMKVTPAHVFRILMVAALLVMILVMRRPCANAIGSFVGQFDAVDAGASQQPKLMTEEEFRKQLDRERDAGPGPR